MSTFAAICIAAGLPEPVPEYRFDPKRRWRADWCWVKERLILEVEGGVWTQGRHTRGKGFINDMEKYNRAAILGFSILRCTPKMVISGDALLLVSEWMGARGYGVGSRLVSDAYY